MKLGLGGSKSGPVEKAEAKQSYVVRFPFTGTPAPAGGKLLDRYPLINPYAYAAIIEDANGGTKYYLDEVPLTPQEAKVYSYILDKLETELTIPRTEVDPKRYFAEQAKRIVAKYGIKVAPLPWAKILYFAERDLVGFGVLDALLKDPNIEDISIDGVGKPLFVYHRRFESLGTNLVFTKDLALDNLITRLAHMAGKHISTAFPILQGTLPGRHRLMATFRREISPYGSTLTVRKFREDPLTIVDLLNSRVIDQKMAAYFWLLMENKATSLVVGSTGSGKTTLLNALLTLTRTNSKIVTIEEVQEVNIPHFNWTALLARENYGSTSDSSSQVNLFDLVKAAMRMRPDIIVVGEVRGEEAYVLFQAISTGHGGACLPGDEPVLARLDGTVRYLPIRSLVEAIEGGAKAEVVSFQEGSRPGFAPVTDVVNKTGTKTFIEFKLRHGKTIRVHDEHPLLVQKGGVLVNVRATDAKIGDLIPVPGEVPCIESVREIDVLELLGRGAESDKLYVRGANLQIASSGAGSLSRQLLWETRSYRPGRGQPYHGVPVGLLDQGHVVPTSQHTIVYGAEGRHGVPAKLPLTRDFGNLIGWYLADGVVEERRRVVFHPGRSRKDAESIRLSAIRVGLTPKSVRIFSSRDGQLHVAIESKVFAHVVDKLGIGRDSYSRRVPDLAFNSPQAFREGLLHGYWRGDGRVRPRGKRSFEAIAETASIDLARSLHLLLKSLAIDSAVDYCKPRHRTDRFDEKSPRYALRIIPGPGKARFRDIIPSLARYSSKASKESPAVQYEPIVSISTFTSDSRLYDLEVAGRGNFLHGSSAFSHNCTIHADDVESAIQRLTSKPMDVPPAFVPFLDLTFTVRRISVPNPSGGFRAVRRIVSVDEVVKVGEYFNTFRWNPSSDTFRVAELRGSPKLNRLAKDLGVSLADVTEELNKRALILRWLQERGVRNFREVSAMLEDYASKPGPVLQKAVKDLGIATTPEAIAAEGFKI
ncbi:MAG: Flp pilus assembly complex ATPase component TadA [Nitrososphaerota archaeon]|nr:Flp pilus assembly complex ATPase component TadA [Nitrososphaerota archaeon]